MCLGEWSVHGSPHRRSCPIFSICPFSHTFLLILSNSRYHSILTIGPTFNVSASAKADLDVDLSVLVGLNYAISSGEFVFPPDGKQANGGFNIVDTR
jgi:hypothetical protein